MKRILSFMLVGVLMFSLAGCFNVVDDPDPDPNPNPGIDCNLYPTHVDCLEEEPEPIAPGLINVLSELPDEQITVTFWHVYGQSKEALLLDYIAEFEEMYPNITIDALSASTILSQKAIARREKFNLKLTEQDFPPNSGYLTQIKEGKFAKTVFVYKNWFRNIECDNFGNVFIAYNTGRVDVVNGQTLKIKKTYFLNISTLSYSPPPQVLR